MRKILCVCSGNTARSPIMQARLQQMLGPEFLVETAGTFEGLRDCPVGHGPPPNPIITEWTAQRGIDISKHTARHVSQVDLREYHLIICVDVLIEHEVRGHLQSALARIIVPDKHRGGIIDPPRTRNAADEYERVLCLAQIERTMREIADELLARS